MRNIFFILVNELYTFRSGDRGMYLIHLFLVVIWSLFLATNILSRESAIPQAIGWIFFSVIVGGNFSNMIFASERISGAMEILLTCGPSRGEILAGKLCFVTGMSVALGLICYALSLVWIRAGMILGQSGVQIVQHGTHILTYCAACFMNASTSAWLALRLNNPRMSYFVNFMIFCGIVAVWVVSGSFFPLPVLILPLLLSICGTVMTILALNAIKHERVISPVQL